jgi:hypothetical protein
VDRVRCHIAVLLTIAAALALAGPAAASQLIGQDARNVTLTADGSGRALVTFASGGTPRQVLAWGAINARHASTATPQVELKLDYRGGTIRNTCAPVKLPLAWFVAACRASDGSYWALQSWQRLLPNGGARPSPAQAVWELRLSHWKGPLADLTVRFGWSYGRYIQMYGQYTYLGQPVFGYRVRNGVPLDGYGRNVYVDALDSDVGKGWQRVNSFLAHSPVGAFCYGFFPHGGKLGVGRRFRATVIGPGVTPDLMWTGVPPRVYDHHLDLAADEDLAELLRGDSLCRPN